MDANVTNRIERVLKRYEDKDSITHICLSKKLYKYLGKPEIVCDLEVIIDDRLFNLAYFFVTSKDYELPARAHTIEFKAVSVTALKIVRTVKPLTDEAEYKTEIAPGTTMQELAFLMSNLIQEMNDAGYCKTEDMFKNIKNYLTQ